MKLRKIIISSLLLAIGLVLHQVVPPILFGMKPDMLLSMMFIAILLNKDYKMALLVGLAAGVLTAATTTFPGGQLPNIIDKLITCNCVYLMARLTDKFNHQIKMFIISIIGTLISGSVFLGSAALLFGLPGSASFTNLMLIVVIPATVVNTIACLVLNNAVELAMKRVSY
jgi:hypothetical protein